MEEESDSARETRKFTPGGEDFKDFFMSRIVVIFSSMIVMFLSRIMVMIMLMTSTIVWVVLRQFKVNLKGETSADLGQRLLPM